MNNLIIGTLVYNEEHKFLKEYLDKISQLTNNIVIIDDGSTDNSLSICSKYTSNINISDRLMTKDESLLRYNLWNECIKLANNGDYILIQDCDELYPDSSIKKFEETLKKADKLQADSIAFNLYDMWNKKEYREDSPYWTASKHLWVRCIRYRSNYNYYWSNKKLHCGSLPINSYYNAYASKLQIQHMAYSTVELRKKKVEFYNNLDPEGQWGIKEQYNSILDENPTLITFKDNFEDNNEV